MPENRPYLIGAFSGPAIWSKNEASSYKPSETFVIEHKYSKKRTLIITPGVIDQEYRSTYAQYSGDQSIFFSCIQGEGLVLLQKFETGEKGEISPDKVSDFYAMRIKQGDGMRIKPNFFFIFYNLGEFFLTIEDDVPQKFDKSSLLKFPENDKYRLIQEMGFICDVSMGQNKEFEFSKNPQYGNEQFI